MRERSGTVENWLRNKSSAEASQLRLRRAVRNVSVREVSASEVSKSSERGKAQGGYGEMG